jgi:hypothetical protein
MAYRVFTIDTATLTPAGQVLVEPLAVIDQIHVLGCPAVAPVLQLGNGDGIPIFTGLEIQPCGADARQGLRVRAPVPPLNGVLQLIVWTGGDGSSSGPQ